MSSSLQLVAPVGVGLNLSKKSISGWKQKKVNFFIEFWIFKLVYVSSFGLNWQFWFFWPYLLKKSISGRKQKKWTALLNFAYSNQSRYQIQLKLTILFFGPNLPKKEYLRSETEKVNSTIEFCILENNYNPRLIHFHFLLSFRSSLQEHFQNHIFFSFYLTWHIETYRSSVSKYIKITSIY